MQVSESAGKTIPDCYQCPICDLASRRGRAHGQRAERTSTTAWCLLDQNTIINIGILTSLVSPNRKESEMQDQTVSMTPSRLFGGGIAITLGGFAGLMVGKCLALPVMAATGSIFLVYGLIGLTLGLTTGLLTGFMFGGKGAKISVAAPLFVELVSWFGLGHTVRTDGAVVVNSALAAVLVVSCLISLIVWKIFTTHRTSE